MSATAIARAEPSERISDSRGVLAARPAAFRFPQLIKAVAFRAAWDGGKVTAQGAKVFVCEGRRVTHDLASDAVIRSLNIAGRLSFDPNKDTRRTACRELAIAWRNPAQVPGYVVRWRNPAQVPGYLLTDP